MSSNAHFTCVFIEKARLQTEVDSIQSRYCVWLEDHCNLAKNMVPLLNWNCCWILQWCIVIVYVLSLWPGDV